MSRILKTSSHLIRSSEIHTERQVFKNLSFVAAFKKMTKSQKIKQAQKVISKMAETNPLVLELKNRFGLMLDKNFDFEIKDDEQLKLF